MRKFMICTLAGYFYFDEIKEGEKGGAYSAYTEYEKYIPGVGWKR
jgi:uncharacterized membrane protein